MKRGTKDNGEWKCNNKIATQFVISIAVIYIILGALLLFVPQIQIKTLCYLLSSILVIFGIVWIVRYFMTDAYKNINEYGFSIGVFTVILGMCALVRVEEVSNSFILFLGIAILMTSVVKLQYALDLKNLKEKTWIIMLVSALIFVICSIIIIIRPFQKKVSLFQFTYWIMIIDGIFSLLSYLFLTVIIHKNLNQIKNDESNSYETKDTIETLEEDTLKENL